MLLMRTVLCTGIALACIVSWTTESLAAEMQSIENAWTSYRNQSAANYAKTRLTSESGPNASAIVSEVWATDDGYAWERTVIDGSGRAIKCTAKIDNPAYSFRVVRPSPSAQWALVDSSANSDNKLLQEFDAESAPLLSVAGVEAVDEFVKRSGFKVTSLKEEAVEGLIRLEFEIESLDGDAKSFVGPSSVGGGYLLLDPQASYIVRKAEVRGAEHANYLQIEVRNEYELIGGIPIPRRKHFEVQPKSGESYFNDKAYLAWELASIPADRFTLTHYGLPEPPKAMPPGTYRTPAWLYYFFGGVLMVIVGAFFVHRATKARA